MVDLSKLSNTDDYQKRICGYFGTFSTNSGTVSYVQTKACLDLSSPDDHSRLVSELVPVREVLDASAMDFDQLLQRDLDDHRVATELIPYLLSKNTSGAAYFPPIVAVLLPFDNDRPRKDFVGQQFDKEISTSVFGTSISSGYRGNYRIDRLIDETTKEASSLQLCQLNWQPERAKLVVIDGQHRAMAVLALYRTLSNKWVGNGERYKAFYVESINRFLASYSDDERNTLISKIEIPVNIIYFPELSGESADQHVAARKLFVDVNQNARKPSRSRIMLLSDRDLISIFLRTTLNEFRSDKQFPISAIEYDNPSSDEQTNSKWCAITNAYVMGLMIQRALMGPPDYFDVAKDAPKGQPSKHEQRTELGINLELKEVLESIIVEDDIEFPRHEISHDNFPPKEIPVFRQQYAAGWGYVLKEIFRSLLPYKVHVTSLREMVSGWTAPDSQSRLALDSVTEGAGVFWTLKAGYSHFSEVNKIRREQGAEEHPITDAIRAWQILEAKKKDFETLRAKKYLGSEKRLIESEAAYEMFATAACQVGIVLALRVVWDNCFIHDRTLENLKLFADKIISALNRSLEQGHRRLFLIKNHSVISDRFNLLDKLDTPRAVNFRYFWLELLAAQEIRVELALNELIDCEKLDDTVVRARCAYRLYLVSQREKDIKRQNPSLSDTKARSQAESEVDKHFSRGLKKFFGIDKSTYAGWKHSCNSVSTGFDSSFSSETYADQVLADDNTETFENTLNDPIELATEEILNETKD